MKRLILLFLLILCWLMTKETKPQTPSSSPAASPVAWLRDGQSALKNAEVKIGSFFVTERNTVYGADCTGCTLEDGVASTSSQIEVTTESVRQSDGKWKKGITYDDYYMIAADSVFPMCTVVRISGHTYSGEGLDPNLPFYAVVVDRGSMIQKNCIDLFAGSERHPLVTHERLSGAVVEIVDFLTYQKNELGQMSCAGE